ncbi:glycosyltransferase [Nesterenkonia pannonica]|uniref:glycosyltransferase family 2 protein n=1 Tax=Nesterenkonia pannonica TaxID=1548602 RepID=UPI002164EC72|nr:glycosyltransferase family 2 protein [Nesterenkonia pannonica]
MGEHRAELELVSAPASGRGGVRFLGQYVGQLPVTLTAFTTYGLHTPGASVESTYDLRLGDSSGRRPDYAPGVVTVARRAAQGISNELLPTLNYWAREIRRNGSSRLTWFSSLARETQSEEARDVLAMASTGGQHDYASLMELLELARLRSEDSRLQSAMAESIWLPSLFTLAQVVYSQRLAAQDFGDVYSIYEYINHTFGLEAFTNGVDRSYYADLLTQRRFTAKAREVLDYEESNATRAYSQRYLELNTHNTNLRSPGEKASTEQWLHQLNDMLDEENLAGIRIETGAEPDFYQLSSEAEAASLVSPDLPLVTVIMPIYEPNAATDVAIRSLLDQTWRDLEIIIVDDASPPKDEDGNPTAYHDQLRRWAAQDDRIRLVLCEANRGAYSVRNDAFEMARGDFVTIADKDDWHHPQRIELQARELMDNPTKHANIVNWARVDEDMMFQIRWGPDRVIHPSFACIMFRRDEVMEKLGYWDPIRKSADNEYRKRYELVFGQKLKPLINAPMAFSLLGDDNLTSSDFGLGYRHPDREVYQWAYSYWHTEIQRGRAARLLPEEERAFYSPSSFRPERRKDELSHFDIVFVSEFGLLGGPALTMRRQIDAAARAGMKVGIMPLQGGLYAAASKRRLAPEIEEAWRLGTVEWVTWNTTATAAHLVLAWPSAMELKPGAPTGIQPQRVTIVASQFPTLPHGGERNYSVQRVNRNVANTFGVVPVWAGQGPVVEEALRELLSTTGVHTQLWRTPVLAPDPDSRQERRATRAVVGRVLDEEERHWPHPDIIRDAYPEDQLFEISLLSSVQILQNRGVLPKERLPSNWSVVPPEMVPYDEYLRSLDFLVHYVNTPWDPYIEPTLVRALELGVVCILHPAMKPVYGDAALYAAPGRTHSLLRSYWDDPHAMRTQQRCGWDFIATQPAAADYAERLVALSPRSKDEEK